MAAVVIDDYKHLSDAISNVQGKEQVIGNLIETGNAAPVSQADRHMSHLLLEKLRSNLESSQKKCLTHPSISP